MKEVTFEELVEKTHARLKLPLPKVAVRFICRHALRRIYKLMTTKRRRVYLTRCDINGIYEDYDWEGLCNELVDIDETKELTRQQKKFIGGIKNFTKQDAKKISHSPMRY
jgi:hypothetical protein